MNDPLNPPRWHVWFWFYYRQAKRRLDRATTEYCTDGCCMRWVGPNGEDEGGVNPVGADHWERP